MSWQEIRDAETAAVLESGGVVLVEGCRDLMTRLPADEAARMQALINAKDYDALLALCEDLWLKDYA